MKQTTITPRGLMTQPNKYGAVPPGTMSYCDNIMFRKPNVCEPWTGFQDYITGTTSTAGSRVRAMLPCDMSTLAYFGPVNAPYTAANEMRWITSHTSSAALQLAWNGSNYSPKVAAGTARMTRSRSRHIVTNDSAPWVFDTEGSTSPRAAGMPVAAGIAIGQSASASGIWAANTQARWTCVFRRTFADGYEIVGAPCQAFLGQNIGTTVYIPTLTVYFTPRTQLKAGDYIDFYRTPFRDLTTDPGSDFYLCATYKLTNSDLSATTWTGTSFTYCVTASATNDLTVDTGLTQALYTNAGVDGPTKANFAPAHALDCVTFRGATLYAMKRGIQLYKVHVPVNFGNSAITGAAGVGNRNVTGTVTSGSANITSVSSTAGLDIGQYITATGVPTGTRVKAISGATVTMTANATSSPGATTVSFADVIEINGAPFVPVTGPTTTALTITTAYYSTDVLGYGFATMTAGGDITFVSHAPYNDSFSAQNDGTFTICATNGSQYSPALPAIGTVTGSSTFGTTPFYSNGDNHGNRLFASKVGQPEHVPITNYFPVGSGNILKLEATRDAVFAFCTDGVYRITGDGVTWRVDPFDLGTFLLCAAATSSMGDVIYAWTNQGVTSISDGGGIVSVSDEFIANDLRLLWESVAGTPYISGGVVYTPLQYSWIMQVSCDLYHDEVWATVITNDNALADTAYVFNQNQTAWSTYDQEITGCTVYADYLRSMLISNDIGGNDGGSYATIRYYRADSDRSQTALGSFIFNPVNFEEPTTLKEWQDVEVVMDGITATTYFNPVFASSVVSYTAPVPFAVPVASASADQRFRLPVPNVENYTSEFVFGLDQDANGNIDPHGSGYGVTPWRFYGFSTRGRTVAEQGAR